MKITICEIESLVTRFIADYFRFENHNVLRDPRSHCLRRRPAFVLTTHETDIITSDPIHSLGQRSRHALHAGIFPDVQRSPEPRRLTKWVPYEYTEPAVRPIATFFSVFPNGTIWSNDISGPGYDVVLMER